MPREATSDDRFGDITERQLTTEREGESRRQCRHERKRYGHKRSARKRMQSRMAR